MSIEILFLLYELGDFFMANVKSKLKSYNKQTLFGGWTRIDMLIQLYDRAISSLSGASEALTVGDDHTYARLFLDAQKTILAIHTGLKPDEYEIAFNVARLLHFVLSAIEQKNFRDAIMVMENLRDGFVGIADEANELERTGQIPAFETHDELHMIM